MFQNKCKDLLNIYQYAYDTFCESMLTDRHLKVRCHTDFCLDFHTQARLRLRVTRSITRYMQTVRS